jgi:predicted ArsR family transcriptional regulator
MSEQIGKHKGAVETLLHEKKELSRILQIVNSQLQRHLSALEEAGIDTEEFIQQVQEGGKQDRRKQEKPGKQQRSKERQRSEQSDHRETGQTEAEEGTDELLEGENDVGNRDFNPNR